MNRAKMQELRARAMRLVSPAMSRLSSLTAEPSVPTIDKGSSVPYKLRLEPVPLNETPKKSRCYKRHYASLNSSGSVELLYASQDDLDNFSREQFSFFYGPFHNKDIANLFIAEYPKLTKRQARTEYNKRRNEEMKASLLYGPFAPVGDLNREDEDELLNCEDED